MKVPVYLKLNILLLAISNNEVVGSQTTPSLRNGGNFTPDIYYDMPKQPQNISRSLERLEAFGGSPPRNKFPLQLCQGDCDRDNDCDEGLICFQKDRGEAVPGCTGDFGSATDFCIPSGRPQPPGPGPSQPNPPAPAPTPAPAPPGSSSQTFRLKLWWQEGYTWQDETFERKWCAMYDYNTRNGRCWYGRETRRCRPDEAYIDRCSNDSRQQFRFDKLSRGEVLIVTAGGGQYANLCLQRDGSATFLNTCNANNRRQRWYAIRGDFDGNRFEISQRGTRRALCLTQAHHPKPAEVLQMMRCSVTRSDRHQTSWWNKY